MNVQAPTLVRASSTARMAALLAGLGGTALCVGAAMSGDPVPVLRAYLVAWLFWLGIALGSMALLFLHALTGGAWGILTHRTLRVAAMTVPLFAVLFIPIALNLDKLYVWADAEVMAHDTLLQKKQAYLNHDFFLQRAAGYFVVWTVGLLLVARRRRFAERSANPVDWRKHRVRSGQFLLLYGVTMTFAAIDWMMSLEPHWYSMIYGVLIFVGQGLGGMAFAIATTMWLTAEGDPAIGPGTKQRDLGSLMLAFVMLWAYMGLSQFLIIWYANLPEEVTWYLARTANGWQLVALAIVALNFVAPFMLLLSQEIKTDRWRLARVGLLVVVMRWVDTLWLVQPAFEQSHFARQGVYIPWLDVAATAAIGGFWLLLVWRGLERRSGALTTGVEGATV